MALPRDGRGLTSFDPMLVNGRGRAKTRLFNLHLTSDTEIPLRYCEAFLFHDQVVSEELVPLATLKSLHGVITVLSILILRLAVKALKDCPAELTAGAFLFTLLSVEHKDYPIGSTK